MLTPDRFWPLLDRAHQEMLQTVGRRHTHPARSVLIREGENAEAVLVLLRGRVKIVALRSTGAQVLLAVRVPGDIVGELAAIDERRRSASVIAVDPVEVLRIPAATFTGITRSRPAVAYALLRVVSTRLRAANHRRVETGQITTSRRVALVLAELSAQYGTFAARGTAVGLPLTQDELASMVGASRESVVRALRVLRRDGTISTVRGRITLLHPEQLAERM